CSPREASTAAATSSGAISPRRARSWAARTRSCTTRSPIAPLAATTSGRASRRSVRGIRRRGSSTPGPDLPGPAVPGPFASWPMAPWPPRPGVVVPSASLGDWGTGPPAHGIGASARRRTADLAEADGNRTRQTEMLGLTSFEDWGAHQDTYASAGDDITAGPGTTLALPGRPGLGSGHERLPHPD